MRYSNQIVQILPSLFHLLTLRTLVVVLVEDVLTHVRPVAHGGLRHVVRQSPRYTPSSNCVGTHGRGTLRELTIIDSGDALARMPVVRALAVYTGSRVLVGVLPHRRSRDSPLYGCQQWTTSVIVGYVGSTIMEPVVQDVADVTR